MTYDWIASLSFLGLVIFLTMAGQFVAFRVPELARMRDLNRKADREKMSKKRFRSAVKENERIALYTNLVFLVAVLPFCLTLESRPFVRHLCDLFVVLMVYDFFYYLTHRFLFHGKLLRKIHALHHQARTPTHMDALYVHPLETIIGLSLFVGTILLVALLNGGALSALSMAVAATIFTQWNLVNHTYVDLPKFPFRAINRVTSLHAAHHVDMNQGNYATLTMAYDSLFGTLEEPVDRSTP
jgi:sterol desaturase/sphingolipid hydroxylase (fatty acid hydroxylase superfamily)